jgi:hypothetical protein
MHLTQEELDKKINSNINNQRKFKVEKNYLIPVIAPQG